MVVFVLVITYYISIGWNRKRAIKFANFEAIAKVTKKKLFPISSLPLIIRTTIIVLIILAAAGIGVWYSGQSSDIDYMLLIDASGSMLATDYEPNRLEAAKDAAKSFIDNLEGKTEAGVIAFAGTPLILQQLTGEKSVIKDAISDIGPISTGGTAIGEAMVLGINIFQSGNNETKAKAIILLTDGQNNVGIRVKDATEYAASVGTIVHTIGIGTEEGATFLDDQAVSQINKEALEEIAYKTGGTFYLVTDKEGLKKAYANIFSTSRGQVFLDVKKYALLIAILLLGIDWILTNTKYKTII